MPTDVSNRITDEVIRVFLCGDVMTGRGIDQILGAIEPSTAARLIITYWSYTPQPQEKAKARPSPFQKFFPLAGQFDAFLH